MKIRSRQNINRMIHSVIDKIIVNQMVVNPFVSEAQRRACYAADDSNWDCSKWESHTKGRLSKRKKGKRIIANVKRKKIKLRQQVINPLRIDPTRTITLRRSFTTKVKQGFDGLKAAILKLVGDEDAFGLGGLSHNPVATFNYDPTIYTDLSKAAQFIEELTEAQRPIQNLALILNTRWSSHSTPEKMAAFQGWLKGQIKQKITSKNQQELWEKYVQAGFRKGAGRAFDDTKRSVRSIAAGKEQMDFYEGTKDQFLKSSFARPVAIEKVQLLVSRSFNDLEGVTEAMSTQMTRTLADGLVQGKSPLDIARNLVEDVDDIGSGRAKTIARTEIIRAHADGQLDALGQLGVEEVGVAVEWSTAGPPYYSELSPKERRTTTHVCAKCEPLEGIVLKLDEARGLIPRHPNCRCAWIPANVGEKDEEQKASKRAIDSAVKASTDGNDEDWNEDLNISKSRPKSVFNRWEDQNEHLAKLYGNFSELLHNSFCPTGPGGGIDPTCSPGSTDKEEKIRELDNLLSIPQGKQRKEIVDRAAKKYEKEHLGAKDSLPKNLVKRVGDDQPYFGSSDSYFVNSYLRKGEDRFIQDRIEDYLKSYGTRPAGEEAKAVEDEIRKINLESIYGRGKYTIGAASIIDRLDKAFAASKLKTEGQTLYRRIEEGVVAKLKEEGVLENKGYTSTSTTPAHLTGKEDGKASLVISTPHNTPVLWYGKEAEILLPRGSKLKIDSIKRGKTGTKYIFASLIESKSIENQRVVSWDDSFENNSFCPTGQGGGIDPSCGKVGPIAPKGEFIKAKKLAQGKIKNAPIPTKEQVNKAREDMKAVERGGRAGGESRGGSAASRRQQRQNLFVEFGGKEKGYVVCPWTGIKMHWTDDPEENPSGYPKFERGKIFTKCQGGGYQLPNLIPESFAANRSRNDMRIRKENSRDC